MNHKTIIVNLKGICLTGNLPFLKGKQMDGWEILENAWISFENGIISGYGEMKNITSFDGFEMIDNQQKGYLLPAFVDSHTHLVFADWRADEYLMRIKGATYEEIAKAGGGILNSAKKLAFKSEDELFESASKRLNECASTGTGAIEIKSGYGLNVESEIKMLKVIKKLKGNDLMTVKSTFLGAHAMPEIFKKDRQGYIKLITNEMLPEIVSNHLADYVDVFCDEGFFTLEETLEICSEFLKFGIKSRLHANELAYSGGVQLGVKMGSVSVDHLESADEEEFKVLLESETIPTLLPGAAHFLNIPYPKGRKMIDMGLGVAIASDFNPGSSPSGNMISMMNLACNKLRMSPKESIAAATINGAYSLELQDHYGSVAVGKVASFILTNHLNYINEFGYRYTENYHWQVYLKGNLITNK